MEYYLNQPPRTYVLIKILFAIVLLIVATFIILFCTLSVDQKVSISKGEIIAQNPSSDFFVPYEAVVSDLRVQEGIVVQIGDTLAILQNTNVEFDFANMQKNLQLQEQKVVGLQGQIASLNKTIQQQEQQRKLYADKHQINQTNAQLDLKSLQQQVYTKQQSLAMLKQQVNNSTQLLKSGGISKTEFDALKQKYLEANTDYNILLKQMRQANGQDALIDNDYSTNINDFELSVLQNKDKKRTHAMQLEEERIRLQQLQNQLKYTETEVAKSYIIADKPGAVANVYNDRKESNFMAKGTLLFSIIPEETQGFYAKVQLPQTAIKEVEKNQQAQLRLQAFSFMKYGIIKGKVSFIHKNEKNEFYALIDITTPNPLIQLKNGYEVQGDIIVKRVKLYEFAFIKLFTK